MHHFAELHTNHIADYFFNSLIAILLPYAHTLELKKIQMNVDTTGSTAAAQPQYIRKYKKQAQPDNNAADLRMKDKMWYGGFLIDIGAPAGALYWLSSFITSGVC